jgi:aquaporin Z
MVHALGDVSGCHLSPAVTIGFYLVRRFEGRNVLHYITSQCVGAVLASLTLQLMFPASATLGATLPAEDVLQSFVLELLLTLILIFVIPSVSPGSNLKGVLPGHALATFLPVSTVPYSFRQNETSFLAPKVMLARRGPL